MTFPSVKDLTIKQKKELFQTFGGIVIILLTLFANGLLSFIVVGFDFSKILTSQFWANYGLLFVSEMAVMFGVYIIQRTKDLNNQKITNLQTHIDNKRELIYQLDKITEAEEWLRVIYNYREKLLIYEEKIKQIYSKIILEEPKQGCKNYDRLKAKYDKKHELREWCLLQFEFIRKDKERLKLIINKQDEQRVKILTKELESDKYQFMTAKIKYREVYWGNLLSDIENISKKGDTPFFNQGKELGKNLLMCLAYGMIGTAVIAILTYPAFKSFDLNTVFSMLVNLAMLIFFMVRGYLLSHKVILGTYYVALEKRKSIYNQMLKDLDISKIEIVEEEQIIK